MVLRQRGGMRQDRILQVRYGQSTWSHVLDGWSLQGRKLPSSFKKGRPENRVGQPLTINGKPGILPDVRVYQRWTCAVGEIRRRDPPIPPSTRYYLQQLPPRPCGP